MRAQHDAADIQGFQTYIHLLPGLPAIQALLNTLATSRIDDAGLGRIDDEAAHILITKELPDTGPGLTPVGRLKQALGGARINGVGVLGINNDGVDAKRHGGFQNLGRDQPVINLFPGLRAVRTPIDSAGGPRIEDVRPFRVLSNRHDIVHFLHAGLAFMPQPAAVRRAKDPDRGGSIERLAVTEVKHELVDDRNVLLQPGIIWHPPLATVWAPIDGVTHGTGVHRRRMRRIHGQRENPEGTEIGRPAFPGRAAVTRLVDRFIGSHIHNPRFRGVQGDPHDRVALFAAGRQREQASEHDHS